MRTLWRKPMSSFLERRWNPSSLNSTKESLKNFFPQVSPALRQCGSTAKSLLGLALESLQRFLPEWHALLLTAQAVPLLTRFWKPLVQPMQSASTFLRRLARLMCRCTIKVMGKINSTIFLLSDLCNSRLPRVPTTSTTQPEYRTSTKASRSSTTAQKFCRRNLFCRFRMRDSYPCFSQAMRGSRPTRDPHSACLKIRYPCSTSFRTRLPRF